MKFNCVTIALFICFLDTAMEKYVDGIKSEKLLANINLNFGSVYNIVWYHDTLLCHDYTTVRYRYPVTAYCTSLKL